MTPVLPLPLQTSRLQGCCSLSLLFALGCNDASVACQVAQRWLLYLLYHSKPFLQEDVLPLPPLPMALMMLPLPAFYTILPPTPPPQGCCFLCLRCLWL
eukprot:188696-Pelagomonas_calceolata.AAC.5